MGATKLHIARDGATSCGRKLKASPIIQAARGIFQWLRVHNIDQV
jgi:hypothetical protein